MTSLCSSVHRPVELHLHRWGSKENTSGVFAEVSFEDGRTHGGPEPDVGFGLVRRGGRVASDTVALVEAGGYPVDHE